MSGRRRVVVVPSLSVGATIQPAVAPTAVVLTVVARGAQFGLKLDWTPAAELAGTVGYERAVRYYSDSSLTTPVSDWITLGTTPGAEAATDESGPYTRPAADQWVRGRVRAVNTDSVPSDPVYSPTPAPKVDAGVGAEPPAAPSLVTLAVLDRGAQFAIRLNWTAAADVGGTVSYERAVLYYADEALSSVIGDWITLGTTYGASTLTDESGPYPRANSDRWVKGRVRALNADGSASAWTYSAGAKVDAGIGAEPPAAPFSVAITVLDRGAQFAIRLNWTAAADVGGTVSYERAVLYYANEALTSVIGDWITLGTTYGASTLTDESGPYPRANGDRWVKGRIRALNADGSASAWTYSAGAKVDAEGLAQIASGSITATVEDFGKENGTNRPMVQVNVAVSVRPTGADYFSVWIYEGTDGSSAPSDIAAYDHAGDQPFTSGFGPWTIPVWRYRNQNDVRLHIRVTASSYSHYTFPNSTSGYKFADVDKIATSAQPSGFNVLVRQRDTGGVPSGRYEFFFAPPPGDPEYWTSNIYRKWCTSAGVPHPSAEWDLVESFSTPRVQPDWWLLPTNAEYWLFQIRSVTKGGLENLTSPPTIPVTVPAAATAVDAVSVRQITFASNITVNVNDGVRQYVILSGPCHFHAPANAANRTLRLTIIQNGAGNHAVTFDAAWALPEGFEPSSYANTYTSLDLWFNSTGRAFHASSPITRMP